MPQEYLPTEPKKWPWWLRWLEPHRAEDRKKFLVRCSCGRLMWLNAPQKIKRLHVGHFMRPCQQGSVRDFIRMKLGLLDRLTLEERFQLWIEKRNS